MSTLLYLFAHAAVIAYALVGGVFLAFSDFIMRALAHTGGSGGVEAMQHVNREVFRWVFMVLLLGLVPVSLGIAGYGLAGLGTPAGPFLALAGLVYLVGCFGVTALFNVPMNEALAALPAAAPETGRYWTGTYLPRWTFWNTVRTLACTLSALLLLVGLALMAQSPAQPG